jgi:hypothetical protein
MRNCQTLHSVNCPSCDKDQKDVLFYLIIYFDYINLSMFGTNIFSSSGDVLVHCAFMKYTKAYCNGVHFSTVVTVT